jgi:hypothetical protein
MRKDDLALFLKLRWNNYEYAKGSNDNVVPTKSWAEACTALWLYNQPRIIVATFAVNGKWSFEVVYGAGVSLSPIQAANPPLRYIFRYAEDTTLVPVRAPTAAAAVSPAAWIPSMPSIPAPDSPCECAIVNTCRNNGVLLFLGASPETCKPVSPLDTTTERPIFLVTPLANPDNTPSSLPMQGTTLNPKTGENTVVQAQGSCRISIAPISTSTPWNWKDTPANELYVYRVDGDSRLMPDPANVWNLHAYGWMLQSSRNYSKIGGCFHHGSIEYNTFVC